MSTLFLTVIILTVVLAFALGMYFLSVRTPGTLTTAISTTGSVTSTSTTTVTSFDTVTSSYSVANTYHLPTSVLVSGIISTTGNGSHASAITFRESNGSSFYSLVSIRSYSITIPNNANFVVLISWSGAYSWQGGVASYNFSTSGRAAKSTMNWNVPTYSSVVTFSGKLSPTGSGTKITGIEFVSIQGSNYSSSVSNGSYTIELPNHDSYEAYATWSGNYSWQSGSLALGSIQTNTSLMKDWEVSTPSSQIVVSGSVYTTGTGTNASALTFQGNEGTTYYVGVSGGKYSVELPNIQSYNISISWRGEFAFQSGLVARTLALSEAPAVTSLSADFNIQTPNSMITVSGSVSTTGIGTIPTGITFSSTVAGSHIFQIIGPGHYSISLPNLANYTTIVTWSGLYPWQSGSEDAGQISVHSNNLTSNWLNVQTPNSDIVVSGNISPSGTGTNIVSVVFTSSHGSYSSILSGSAYSATLPNIANYSLVVMYSGQFSWQNGTTSFPLSLNGGAGVSTFMANWNIPTPDSMVIISGTLSYGSAQFPYEVRFVSQNGGVIYSAAVSSGSFSLTLPNDVNYSVIVYYTSSGLNLSESVGAFDLYATPGVSTIHANWSV